MKQLWIILAMMVFLGMGTSSVWAHTHHPHHPDGVNPFQSGKVQKPAHCLLNHHRYPIQICPHHKHNPGSPIQELATDCGGAPAGSLPQNIPHGSPTFMVSESTMTLIAAACGNTSSSSFPATTLYYDLTPPPPESI